MNRLKQSLQKDKNNPNNKKDKNNPKHYYLNYLKMNDDGSEVSSVRADEDNSTNSFVDINMDSDPVLEAPRPPPNYASHTRTANNNHFVSSDSESSTDSIVDIDDEDYTDEDTNPNNTSTDSGYSAASSKSSKSGRYLNLNMDAAGMVVKKISTAIMGGKAAVSPDRSVSSVPRTALPTKSQPTQSLLSKKSSEDDEFDDVEDYDSDFKSSFVLEPPDATDYAPAEVVAPKLPTTNSYSNSYSNNTINNLISNSVGLQPKTKPAAKPKTKPPPKPKPKPKPAAMPMETNFRKKAIAKTNRGSPTRQKEAVLDLTNTSTDETEQRRLEEEAAAERLLANQSFEAPPPSPPKNQNYASEVLPPDHYSHLLKAYEVERDPSRITPMPPPQEFVQSPTDETYRNVSANHNTSGDANNPVNTSNSSFEDDIEVGSPQPVAADLDASRNNNSTSSHRSRRKGLFTIFSPRAYQNSPSDKKNTTPDTEASSPSRRPGEFRGKQLFVRGNDQASNGTGRLGIESSFDYSVGVTDAGLQDGRSGHHRQDAAEETKMRESKKRKRKQTLCFVLILLLGLALVVAVAVVGYAMYARSQRKGNASSTALVDIVAPDNSPTPTPNIIIEVVNTTASATSESNTTIPTDFEWMTTTAPYNTSQLRPVTLKNPTAEPTGNPTAAPTITRRPTGTPTRGPTPIPTTAVPTPVPTFKPTTQAPVPTMFPTAEGDFVGRLETLLQLEQFGGESFRFDFSTAAAIDDPVTKALVYMAREIGATANLPPPEEAANAEGVELGTVVVTVGDSSTDYDPTFRPIDLRGYDDEKLLQRFALLAVRLGAGDVPAATSASSTTQAVEPKTRLVLPDEELAEAVASGQTEPPTTKNKSNYVDPASLGDPADARFLVDECDWEGVTCVSNANATSTIVSGISWGDRQLQGSLSSTLGLLTALTSLDISHNNLVGSIPESLYELTNLEEIYLYQNSLTGTISTQIGSLDLLRRFHLSHNRLMGTLPTELKSDGGSENGIRPIEYFNVYDNNLTGEIPLDLRWRRCVIFDVGRNQLTGSLPDDLGQRFVGLRHLYLDHNQFTGEMPASYNTVGNGRLISLALEDNQLTGYVPGDRDNFEILVSFTLQNNQFSGVDPQNCRNALMVEYKADCNVCNCFGRFFGFCDRWCNVDEWRDNADDDWRYQAGNWIGQPPPRPPPQSGQGQWGQRPPPNRNWAF